MSDTKIGQKRKERKVYKLKKKRIKPVSIKHAEELKRWYALQDELREKCGNRSELSGDIADWRTDWKVEGHHILGRGKNLLNVFAIILCTRSEHELIEAHNTPDTKQKLLDIVKPLRIQQGYKEEDYE